MKKNAKFLWLIFFCTVIIYGCRQNHTKPVYRVVTQVDIVTRYDQQLIHIGYNTPEKMRPILLYLRLLKPEGNPIVPDEDAQDVYLFRISLSDGTQHYYRQAAHRYVSKESGPWKAVDPGHAAKLYGILRELPADV